MTKAIGDGATFWRLVMTRDEFRNAVFQRDGACVICGAPGQDAHHIIERRLWDDGGYYMDNGALLCGPCHIRAEQTVLSVDEIRDAAGVDVLLPEHLYRDHSYDKWGNVILPNGQRMPGELFYDESVQKILKPVLGCFTRYVKYPRTYHLPWSNGTKDDRFGTFDFEGREVVVTEKMDGENTTFYSDYLHARSIDSDGPGRSWVKNFHAKVGWQIPEGWRVCGENLYAKHSIHYDDLTSYFQVFSIWDRDRCLSWSETVEWCELLSLTLVPILYEGIWDESIRRFQGREGYVVRIADAFSYGEFRKCVAKYVRPNHVNTSHHWRFEKIVRNELR